MFTDLKRAHKHVNTCTNKYLRMYTRIRTHAHLRVLLIIQCLSTILPRLRELIRDAAMHSLTDFKL